MTTTERISIRGYSFTTQELLGKNPYNDNEGTPLPELMEQSYAWSEGAYLYRFLKNENPDRRLDYNNFGI